MVKLRSEKRKWLRSIGMKSNARGILKPQAKHLQNPPQIAPSAKIRETMHHQKASVAASKSLQQKLVAVQGGLGFRVVNGEIVEDEDTLQIDRRAQAQAEIAMQAPVEEENDADQIPQPCHIPQRPET
ncbi:hypothetical protein L1887_63302 [Cichorium endivia]|nr:hypothetical protein L1887_63302 [Cichorium endivia]